RILHQWPRVDLHKSRADRRHHDFGIEQGRDRLALANNRDFHGLPPDQFGANSVPLVIAICSTIGPSASAGKKMSPPIITMTPTTSPTKRPPVVGKVPAEGGIDFFAAREPPMAVPGLLI